MGHDPAYKQLLTLINARGQQWLRNRIELFPMLPAPDHPHLTGLAEIAVAAHICSGLRGTPAPLQTFIRSRFTPDFVGCFLDAFQHGSHPGDGRGTPLFRLLPHDERAQIRLPQMASLAERLALSDGSDPRLLAEAEAFLRAPVPAERLTERDVDTYACVLMLCYRFGAERPRFADARTYGDAFANCLRFAEWAERKGRLMPLAQMCYCLCLIDPDHDVAPMLGDIIASQRPDGSFPDRIGFGTADQGEAALRPTLATLVALHMAVHRRWQHPRPSVPLAA
ncbi:hypothetical protein [Paracoccus benzoatiresistens]|uniref:Uncharacterized protein n=1 Tax=Paracoccus benzoatiresistens TaxID=2997341 RepID=A0ABT4JCK5_9RHOB|nr:hypothetical protein [Paracoccus sp. EF6]MCZ0964073.1 hypothetical protein [Paracoccus sp. EF6]